MLSPPPDGSKKVVLLFLSVNNIVNPPASTGRLNRSSQLVTNRHQGNRGIEKIRAKVFCLHIVVVQMKFIDPSMLPIPAE